MFCQRGDQNFFALAKGGPIFFRGGYGGVQNFSCRLREGPEK